MAITNLYPNLPGHLVEFKDGGMQLRNTAVTGNSKSLLILGTAIDGPINEPVAIDAENVHKLFGNDIDETGIPNGTTLTKYIRQAYKAGFNDIRAMRVTGSVASGEIKKDTETSSELIPLTAQMVASGNKTTSVTLPFPESVPEGQFPAIKKGDVKISHPIVSTIANTYNLPNEVVILASQVPARGDITVDYITELVNTVAPVIVDTGKVTSNTEADGSGDNVIKVTVPAASMINVYEYNMDGLTVGVAETDNHSVPTNANLVAVTTNAGETVYKTLKLMTAESVEVIPTGVIMKANGDYEISFVDTGSAGTPTYAIDDSFSVEFVGYTEVEGSVVISQSNLYTPQKIKVASDKLPILTEEVFLYDSTGNNVIAKYSDSNGVIVFNDILNEFIIDLSKVSNVIPLSYVTINSTQRLVYSYEVINTVTENIVFRSINGGDVYNQASVTVDRITKDGVEGRLFTLTKPVSKKYTVNEPALTFSSFNYPTFGSLRDAVKTHALNNVFDAATDYEDGTTADFPVNEVTNSITVAFTGGTNGVYPTNDEMFKALSGARNTEGELLQQGAYQILENYHVDSIYVAGVHGDAKVSSNLSKAKNPFHYELALLCAVLTYRTKMTHGYIDLKPNTNTTLVGIQNYVSKLLSYDNTFYMIDQNGDVIYDEDNNPMDIGWYTSAVVGPEPVCSSATLGNYYGSPSIAYAALNAGLTAQSAPTNKALPGCMGMRFKFSNKQLNDLTRNRFVVFKLKDEGVSAASKLPYVVDGCTCGAPGSDYGRLTSVKVVTRVIDEVREVADPFIGEPNTVEQRNALAALISKRLSSLKEQGVIQYFEFEIGATVSQVLSGEASIALTLVPPQELRKITTVVALRAAA